jgi:hypothetical protein
MIKTEFGIIDNFEPDKEYKNYEPQKYSCIAIDDDRYLNDWWNSLLLIPTYNMSLRQPQTALSRWGITLIPPESLPDLLKIVEKDGRIRKDRNLMLLAEKIHEAIIKNKYMIHYGI